MRSQLVSDALADGTDAAATEAMREALDNIAPCETVSSRPGRSCDSRPYGSPTLVCVCVHKGLRAAVQLHGASIREHFKKEGAT